MANDISTEELDRLVWNIAKDNFISFSADVILSDGRESMKAFYITITFKAYILSKVMIDNGSSLNVILSRLSINMSYMKRNHTVVKAFNGIRRKVSGNIKL